MKVWKYNRKQMVDKKLTPSMVDYLIEAGTKIFQTKKGLVVDGMAGPETQKALQLTLPGKGLGYHPTGKGVYIRKLKKLGTPEQLVKQALDVGLSFVVIGSVWQHNWGVPFRTRRFNSRQDLERYSKAFQDAGIEVWVWGYPQPGLEEQFVEAITADALWANAVGILIDPEKPFRKKRHRAGVLIAHIRPKLQDLGLAFGVTSYGSAFYFKDFPYKEFAAIEGTYGSPQVYDNKNNLPTTHTMRSFNSYMDAGYSCIVMSSPGYRKTSSQLKRLLSFHPAGVKGVIFWDWANLRLRKNRHLWEVIKNHSV